MRSLSILALIATLAACAPSLNVVVERDEAVAAGKTFYVISGLEEAKAGRSSKLASDFVYGRFDSDIARAMTEQGFVRTLDAERADLVVRYSVFAREWITARSVPPPPLSAPPPGWDRLMDGPYNTSYSELEVQDHRAGTMVVDVVATDGGALVYRFFIEGALTGNPKDNLTRAEEAIAEGFEDFEPAR